MMKRIFFPLLLIAMITVQSCEKHDASPKNIVLNATLASGEEYKLNLEQYNNESPVVSIAQQAVHAQISDMIAGTLVYHYKATTKATVQDQVKLTLVDAESNDGNDHHQCGDDSTHITINFTVNN